MVSIYLSRPPRDRMLFLRDLAVRGVRSDWETLCQSADTFGVVVAETDLDEAGRPVFTRIAGDLQALAGYDPDELIGKNPTILQCDATNQEEARRLMPQVDDKRFGEIRIVNQRKTGELYGCHIVAARIPRRRNTPERLVAFLRECELSECP